MLEGQDRTHLTPDEEDAIFNSIIEPTSRNRRFGYGN